MKLRYIDSRPFIINLKKYRTGIAVPNPKLNNVLEVTDDEARQLLKSKNGENPCWESAEPARRRNQSEEK